MFTGLIQETGRLRSLEAAGDGVRIVIEAPELAREGLARGESVAVDGACLTVERADSAGFEAFASAETLRRTTLGAAAPSRRVNLERALALGARLGGHLVQGHVDARATLREVRVAGESRELVLEASAALLRDLIEKGSVAVDGISLTVASLATAAFTVWVIPETWRATALPFRRPGEALNVELDLIGKYVFRYLDTLAGRQAASGEPAPGAGAPDERLLGLLGRGGWGGRPPAS